jgi:hypothetical protein
MRNRRPHVFAAEPTILLAPPRGERKGEVQSNNHVGFGLTKLKKLRDELTTVEPVSQLSQFAVVDLGSPKRLRRPFGLARPVDSEDSHERIVAVLEESTNAPRTKEERLRRRLGSSSSPAARYRISQLMALAH